MARRLAEEERGLTRLTAQVDEQRAENEQLPRRASGATAGRRGAGQPDQRAGIEGRDPTRAARARPQAAGRTDRDARRAGRRGRTTSRDKAATSWRSDAASAQARTASNCKPQLAANRRDAAGWHETARSAARAAQRRQRAGRGAGRAGKATGRPQRRRQASAHARPRAARRAPSARFAAWWPILLHVNFETAPLVEVALGEMAQCLVVAGGRELVDHLQRIGFAGRPRRLHPARRAAAQDASRRSSICTASPGVLGRADEFVETAPEFAVLAKRLLGKTWIVESLADALALAESVGRGLSFVTRAGELVAADGTLYVGPRHTSTGLISRRSELRVLRQQIAEMAAADRSAAGARCAELERADRGEDRQRARRCRPSIEQLERRPGSRERLRGRRRRRTAGATGKAARGRRQRTGGHGQPSTSARPPTLAESQARLAEVESDAGRARRPHRRRRRSAASELEQARQRISREKPAPRRSKSSRANNGSPHLQAQQSQLERDQQERGRALADSRTQLAVCLERLRQAEREILAPRANWPSSTCARKASPPRRTASVGQRDEWREQRAQLAADAQRLARQDPQAGNPAARQGTGRRRSAPRADHAGRSAARGLRHRAGRAGARALGRGIARARRRSSARSPTCAASSTASAA